ncbi:uncharacterized protein SPPG_07654 [Spizellomyces punctatus DAOM BR117]|uniref:Uncharacterized protein n=1 Tax=Spizellomyces punctatus (strain DAOM BR117) TaxID=645134 RepID=A0A0L0H6X5_SPIPD|nr:uncharacterized protein SPPG_07654 [Spizellomyces punctatus DAOM BR117]KNC97265.1 hypothetical protein SPPG_07654 [Spizellomyces punctatus DAOM BR117]|eukprot:XP_016605305.1 hypothetical protein SPPG_07654 [Spizellomyces punctatus DAOM BR117]
MKKKIDQKKAEELVQAYLKSGPKCPSYRGFLDHSLFAFRGLERWDQRYANGHLWKAFKDSVGPAAVYNKKDVGTFWREMFPRSLFVRGPFTLDHSVNAPVSVGHSQGHITGVDQSRQNVYCTKLNQKKRTLSPSPEVLQKRIRAYSPASDYDDTLSEDGFSEPDSLFDVIAPSGLPAEERVFDGDQPLPFALLSPTNLSAQLENILESQLGLSGTKEQKRDPFLHRIVDLTGSIIGQPQSVSSHLSNDMKKSVKDIIGAVLTRAEWQQVDSDVNSLFNVMKHIPADELVRLGRESKVEGFRKTLTDMLEMDEGLTAPTKNGGFIRNLLTSVTASKTASKKVATSVAIDNKDVQYVLNLLYEVSELSVTARSERDLDIDVHQHLLLCLRGVVDKHYGELESRASRDRRIRTGGKTRGASLDWLFTSHAADSSTTWGVEFGAAANIGSSTVGRKPVTDRCGLYIILRDIHIAMSRRILDIRRFDDTNAVRKAVAQLPVPGIILHNFRYVLVAVVYLEGGWYVTEQLGVFELPVFAMKNNFGAQLVAAARQMLHFRNILRSLRDAYFQLIDTEVKIAADPFDGSKAWITPA